MNSYSQLLPGDDATEYTVIKFIVDAVLAGVQTVSLAQVMAVNTAAQTVDVAVLVNLVTGNGISVPHGVIHKRPYFRLQGGGNAIICDPVAGDIGIMAFGSRDLSGVIAAKGTANPGSARSFDWADGLYFGGILNAAPTQYVRIDSSGVTVVSPTLVTLQAPTVHVQGNLTVSGMTTGTGDGVFAGIDVATHVHSGVTSGGSDTGPPV